MKKRVFSLVIAVLLVLAGGVPAGASDSEFTTGDFTTADALTVLRAAVGFERLTREQEGRLGFERIDFWSRPATDDALRILQIATGILPQPEIYNYRKPTILYDFNRALFVGTTYQKRRYNPLATNDKFGRPAFVKPSSQRHITYK